MSGSDDDEDEENEGANEGGDVKQEPGESRKHRDHEKSPSFELHVYSEEELSKFTKRELIADAELLDGMS